MVNQNLNAFFTTVNNFLVDVLLKQLKLLSKVDEIQLLLHIFHNL